MEDIHLKEMDTIVARLRSAEEEKRTHIEEKEELKKERDQLLQEVETMKAKATPSGTSSQTAVSRSLRTIISGI